MFLPRLERYASTLDADTRAQPGVAAELAGIAGDTNARDRFLDLARDAESAAVRARMVALAERFGWLSEDTRRDELALMWREQLERGTITPFGFVAM